MILSFAQVSECGTPGNFPNLTPISATTFDNCPVYVNIIFHIVQDNNGNEGISSSDLPGRFNELQQIFAAGNIHLINLGFDVIKNSSFVNFSTTQLDNLVAIQRRSNALNIYIVPNFIEFAGEVEAIPSIALVVSKDFFNKSTLPHEIGHAFNLFHTHHGIELGGCIELIDGSNCTICGDFICDTPADPMLGTGTTLVNEVTCAYIGEELQNGLPFTPSTNNIMSRAPKHCRTMFTVQQYARMLSSIQDQNMVLKNIRTFPPYEITGASNFCTSATYSVSNVPTGSTVTWSISPSAAATLTASGNNVTVNKVQNNVSITLTANVVNDCGNKTVTRTAYMGTISPNSMVGFSGNGSNFARNTLYNFSINAPAGTIGYQWSVAGGTIQSGQGTSAITVMTSNTTPNVDKYFDVRIKVQNACGWSNYLLRTGYIKYGILGQQRIMAIPNPTKGDIIVSDARKDNTEIVSYKAGQDDSDIYDFIRIYNILGQEQVMIKNSNTIDLHALPNGRYILQASKNGIIDNIHILKY